MAIADMLPTMDDSALATLRSNAARLEGGVEGAQQKQAALLIPLIDAELGRPRRPQAPQARARHQAQGAEGR